MTNQELLLLRLAEYTLRVGSIRNTTDSLIRSRRKAGSAQDLVLTTELDELEQRVNDASRMEWPVLLSPDPEAASRAELITAYESYIDLLVEEISDLVGLAIVHGWKSERFEAGEKARARIAQAKEALYGSV